MSLEENAQSRKERLAALRRRKEERGGNAVSSNGDADKGGVGDRRETFTFRNYDPATGKARKHDRLQGEDETVEKLVDGLAERIIKEDEEKRQQELDLFNIQPKKPNWDLKRDLDKKMAKLEPKTQAAFAQLIRNRLQAQKGDDAPADLASRLERTDIDQESESDEE